MLLVLGNKTYSSWSLRGWLACRLSGRTFEERVVPLDRPEYAAAKAEAGLLPAGRVPVLHDQGVAVWDSLAIVEHLAEVDRDRFWPADRVARAHARSVAAEMHSGFAALRGHLPMNVRRHYPGWVAHAEAAPDIARVVAIWSEARGRFGAGDECLYGAFGAADAMFAPVASRFTTYDVALPPVAEAYRAAVMAHPWVTEWVEAAHREPWTIAKDEF